MICSNCGADNRTGGKFCVQCGHSLTRACPRCGTPIEPVDKFCSECGLALSAEPPQTTRDATPAAERRLVSVLFADLVGFTTLSEARDPEEVRDLLTAYFDTCRRLIERYGGTVEKFIGDAVMAVWGAPVATEDDAERAVRAALELVSAVTALGQSWGIPELRARAGVVTGEAAVNLAAKGQGMVAGDVVNTASRVQSVAEPGLVLVDSSTRRATKSAIDFEDVGGHTVKGRTEPVELWRALRVLGGRGGAGRGSGLEAPFVGRDREMRLIKELFHAAADESRAHLVSVVGVAGIGKSRLAWEFEKYADGVLESVWWHRGRCLSYGEGVAYWALAEMIRMRAGILEEDEPGLSLEKLRLSIESHIADPHERRWLEPRLGHLLNLQERSFKRDDLFAGWRLFFERMSQTGPVVLVFEDIQWADSAMLDFIEYLLEWSRSYPLFVLTLARPELSDRRADWGAGKRNFTSLFLEPLPAQAMDELVTGLVPGLPSDRLATICERAEGIPLYAVETVRMLLDRGLIQRHGSRFTITSSLGPLDVPETLHALIAARLDGLTEQERRLLQDASVAGKSFTPSALSALSGQDPDRVETLLAELSRKDLVTVQVDPMSPERGQYSFLQELVRTVAYETLSLKERKVRHLAMAAYLESGSGYDTGEIVEVISSHYLQAYRAAASAPDAAHIKEKARQALIAAGERAAALAASEEAQRYFEQAIELTEEPIERAQLSERGGQAARTSGRTSEAGILFKEAIATFESQGQSHPAARVWSRLAEIMWDEGRIVEALERLEQSLDLMSEDEPDEDLAMAASMSARLALFANELDIAASRVEFALDVAEKLWLPEVISQALNTKAVLLHARGRRTEAAGLLKQALEVALENDASSAALRAYQNLAFVMSTRDRYDIGLGYVEEGIALARRLGAREEERHLSLTKMEGCFFPGSWQKAVELLAELPSPSEVGMTYFCAYMPMVLIHVYQGNTEAARRLLAPGQRLEHSRDPQDRAGFGMANAAVLRSEGDLVSALRIANDAIVAGAEVDWRHDYVKAAFPEAVEAAFGLGELERVRELLAIVDEVEGASPAMLTAHARRFRARLAALEGEHAAAALNFKSAAGTFREVGTPFYLALTLLDHGEWLISRGQREEAEPLLAEAAEIFQTLGATPSLERLSAISPASVSAGDSAA